jgi:hypothetical protein
LPRGQWQFRHFHHNFKWLRLCTEEAEHRSKWKIDSESKQEFETRQSNLFIPPFFHFLLSSIRNVIPINPTPFSSPKFNVKLGKVIKISAYRRIALDDVGPMELLFVE